jgi:hypothetical protein
MTIATEFDPRTAKERAAQIVDEDLCTYDDMGPLEELHAQCFTALGETADAIAATLAELGCNGSRPDKESEDEDGTVYGDLVDTKGCALAVYFRGVCGAASASFGTSGGFIYWDGTESGAEIGHESVELPDVVAEFQRGYQDFEYADLYNN